MKDATECKIPCDDEHIGPVLLSPYGLKALERANQLSKEEKEGLMGSCLPPSQYAYILLVWVGIHVMEGLIQRDHPPSALSCPWKQFYRSKIDGKRDTLSRTSFRHQVRPVDPLLLIRSKS